MTTHVECQHTRMVLVVLGIQALEYLNQAAAFLALCIKETVDIRVINLADISCAEHKGGPGTPSCSPPVLLSSHQLR